MLCLDHAVLDSTATDQVNDAAELNETVTRGFTTRPLWTAIVGSLRRPAWRLSTN